MNRYSIFFKLNLIFLFSLITLIAFFMMMMRELQSEELQRLEDRVIQSELEIRKILLTSNQNREEALKTHHYLPIKDPSSIKEKLTPIFQTPPPSFPTPLQERIRDGRLKIYRDDHYLYFELIGKQHSRMIAIPFESYRPQWITLFFGGMLGLIILLYWMMRRSLYPLKTLAKQIQRFGEGDMTISTRSDKKDEIAYVANQFDTAVRKLQAMKEARTLFMRNIMHELKTPITKGKLSIEFLEESEETKVLRHAFSRMEQLIQEMADIEFITSQSFQLKMRPCNLYEMIHRVAKLLFIHPEQIQCFCHPCTLIADCDMLTIVLKNLIDNALKYGEGEQIQLCYKKGVLEVINRGEPLTQDFEQIMEPFTKGSSRHAKESFGLGLYIVKSILDAHGARLSHHYHHGHHYFVIHGLKPLKQHAKEAKPLLLR